MAIVVRYFSTTSAGAGDGTTWADRAEFISGGAYSTIITAFDFIGPDSLEVRLGPGTYSAPSDFSSSQFTSNQPRPEFPLVVHGCDSSGNRIVPDVGWQCAEGALDDSSFPIIDLSSTRSFNLANMTVRCVAFTSSRTTNFVTAQQGMLLDFCTFENTASNANAACVSVSGDFGFISNCHLICSGTAFDYVLRSAGSIHNLRIEGNSSATSGNRRGLAQIVSGFISQSRGPVCVFNCPNEGIINTVSTSAGGGIISQATVINCGTGVSFNTGSGGGTTANGKLIVEGCYIANCTTGISATNAAPMLFHTRLRNTTDLSVPTNNYQFNLETAAGSDSAELVNVSGGNYLMKVGSSYYGKGYGAGDEIATGGTSKPVNPFTQTVIA